QRIIELFFQENLPLGQLALVDAVDFPKPGFLRGGERLGRRGAFGQPFHREFVGAFHTKHSYTKIAKSAKKFRDDFVTQNLRQKSELSPRGQTAPKPFRAATWPRNRPDTPPAMPPARHRPTTRP